MCGAIAARLGALEERHQLGFGRWRAIGRLLDGGDGALLGPAAVAGRDPGLDDEIGDASTGQHIDELFGEEAQRRPRDGDPALQLVELAEGNDPRSIFV
jgi:hypothetical protein